jgi:hypothetical protein
VEHREHRADLRELLIHIGDLWAPSRAGKRSSSSRWSRGSPKTAATGARSGTRRTLRVFGVVTCPRHTDFEMMISPCLRSRSPPSQRRDLAEPTGSERERHEHGIPARFVCLEPGQDGAELLRLEVLTRVGSGRDLSGSAVGIAFEIQFLVSRLEQCSKHCKSGVGGRRCNARLGIPPANDVRGCDRVDVVGAERRQDVAVEHRGVVPTRRWFQLTKLRSDPRFRVFWWRRPATLLPAVGPSSASSDHVAPVSVPGSMRSSLAPAGNAASAESACGLT